MVPVRQVLSAAPLMMVFDNNRRSATDRPRGPKEDLTLSKPGLTKNVLVLVSIEYYEAIRGVCPPTG